MQLKSIISPAQPASGKPRAVKLDLANEWWCRPISLFFAISTDGTAGQRIFSGDVIDAAGNRLFALFESTLGPSQKNAFVQMALTKATIATETVNWRILPELWLPPQCSINIVDTNDLMSSRDMVAMNAVIETTMLEAV